MKNFDKYLAMIKQSGAHDLKFVHPAKVVVGNWVRLKCQFGCDAYGTRLTCPPYSPTPDYTRQMLTEYQKALFFTYQINHRNERRQRQSIRKFIARLEQQLFLDGYYKVFVMGAGPCNICSKCDVTKTCLHPEIGRPSMEACGIDVFQTALNCGIELQVVKCFTENPTYCCLLLIE